MGLTTIEKHQPKSQHRLDNEKSDKKVSVYQISSHTPIWKLCRNRLNQNKVKIFIYTTNIHHSVELEGQNFVLL